MVSKRLYLSPPHLNGREKEFILDALASNYITPMGPMVDAFEAEFAKRVGYQYALAVVSGTAAIHLALRELGVSPGDEVMASTLTFIGGVAPILYLGAKPVFIDSDETSWNMDPALLAEELAACAKRGKLPKAVLPTDAYGQSCDLDKLREVCASYGIPMIVDAAESVGATYKGRHAGAGTDAAVYSFNGNKVLTTGGGGVLASNDKNLIDRAKFLACQARDPAPHYEHTEIGYNYRMSNILAAIGRGQLLSLDERIAKRRWIFEQYQAQLADVACISFMPEASYGKSSRWLTAIQLDPALCKATPDELRVALDRENIEARPVWKPMHLQPVFKDARVVGGSVSARLFERGLCLPSGSAMEMDDIQRVVALIKRVCGNT